MAYTVTHKNGNEVTIYEIGDTIEITNRKSAPESLLGARPVSYTFKHARKYQNRSKY